MIALVQRPRRKMHLAASSGRSWLSLCDRVELPIEGTPATALGDALGTIDEHAEHVCVDCRRLILFAAYVGRHRVAAFLESLVRAA